MVISFTKMHGLGNDFVVIDALSQKVDMTSERAQFIADRRFGIGCDQILLVEKPTMTATADFKYRIFNADGSEVEQCGNGARCFALFVKEQNLTDKNTIMVETFSGLICLEITDNNEVRVDMGKPNFNPESLPFTPSELSFENNLYYINVPIEQKKIASSEMNIAFSAVSMGNPHITIKVDDLDNFPVQEVGCYLESHTCFPQRVNVGFMQIIDKHNIRLRVYERGAGETLACGTGACAAVANGIAHQWLATQVNVIMASGQLNIAWIPDETLIMTGPASFVFQGNIDLQ